MIGVYNPLRIRIAADGRCVDKYGRGFELDEREFKRIRRRVKTPAIIALRPK